jgi:alpha-N-acetylglucosaminidase
MLELGIQPVLPGFTGYVPNTVREVIKTAEFIDGGIWCGHPKQPYIKLGDPLFNEFGKIFYEEQKKLYGEQKFITASPVGEGTPPEGYSFSDAGKQIQDLIFDAFPEVTWVLGGWQDNPRPELLEKADKDRTLILDLWGETRPQWKRADRFDLYRQTPWIWNIINNFGGNNGLFGNLELIFTDPIKARASEQGAKLCGLGTMMEGIENNPVVYHAVYESAWLDAAPDIDEWLKGYAKSRYGASSIYAERAWSILNKTVYHATLYQEGPSENLMCARPGLDLKSVSTWGTSKLYYSPDSLLLAWDAMIKAAEELGNNDAFQYDLVDLTRQVISNYAYSQYPEIVDAYKKNDMQRFRSLSTSFLGLFDDLNNILKTKKEFLVGPWISDARSWGRNPEEEAEYERQAKTIITTWGDWKYSEPGNLHDYSFREWEGIMLDLYKNRWETYFELLSNSTSNGEEPCIDWYSFDYSWITNNKEYETEPVGNPVEACTAVYNKYRDL